MRGGGRTALVGALAVLALLGGGIGVWKVIDSPPPPASITVQQAAPLAESPLIATASLSQAITSLQQRLKLVPGDWRSFAGLGLAYVQEARITADPSYYPKAEGVLQQSLALNRSENDEAAIGMGALAAARHDFAGALAWGRRAERINPYDDNAYGVIGDALVELGRYPQAFAAIQHMVELKPQLSSYARVSYQFELRGETRLALSSMRDALNAAGTPEDAAWASYQLGELFWNEGRIGAAAKAYANASQFDPTFVPPKAGLAKVAWARGQIADAIRRYSSVVKSYPLPEYVIALGDLETISGRDADAAREYALARAEERLFTAAGVNIDLELALFDVDHGRVAPGLAAARAEWGRRQSIQVADAFAWALYRAGHAREALGYARKALSLGMRNALFFFHAGMIERALGDTRAARSDLSAALDINPTFSILHASEARRVMHALGGNA